MESMIQKKICMIGAYAVGKTSLVTRFVESIFSTKYLTTVGVKINKKTITLDGKDITLILWDLHGEDEFQKLRLSYLRGSSGYILVADGTRRDTLEKVISLLPGAEEMYGKVPHILALNKSDLGKEWDMPDSVITDLQQQGWTVIHTSAKTGLGVEDLFTALSRKMMEPQAG